MNQSAGKQVARAAAIVVVFSVASKLLGFVREQVIAGMFGATGVTDAYVTVNLIPQILNGLFGGTVSAAFLPVLMHLQNGNSKPAERKQLISAITQFLGLKF